jgi:hypothetical protein
LNMDANTSPQGSHTAKQTRLSTNVVVHLL